MKPEKKEQTGWQLLAECVGLLSIAAVWFGLLVGVAWWLKNSTTIPPPPHAPVVCSHCKTNIPTIQAKSPDREAVEALVGWYILNKL